MSYIPADLRRLVIDRAGNYCEYCQLAQEGQEATFHIDHVVPFSAGGVTEEENLALACVSCSLRKAARQQAVDPESDQTVSLYNPRQDNWHDHFRWDGTLIIGLSSIGRATVVALSMNRSLIVNIRQVESLIGRHPPPK